MKMTRYLNGYKISSSFPSFPFFNAQNYEDEAKARDLDSNFVGILKRKITHKKLF
jgi:hypothetical protein